MENTCFTLFLEDGKKKLIFQADDLQKKKEWVKDINVGILWSSKRPPAQVTNENE